MPSCTPLLTPLHAGEEQSDGYKNLAHAIEVALHNAKKSVSIVMHSMVFDPDRLKPKEKGQPFVEEKTR